MPTYQYACTACDARLDAVQTFTDSPLTECPACEGRLRKVYSAVGVVFKGSGFYKTDSRDSKKPAAATADAGKGEGSKGEGGKDAGKGSDAAAKLASSDGGSSKTPAASSTSSTPVSKSA